jgi:hypothetical protein
LHGQLHSLRQGILLHSRCRALLLPALWLQLLHGRLRLPVLLHAFLCLFLLWGVLWRLSHRVLSAPAGLLLLSLASLLLLLLLPACGLCGGRLRLPLTLWLLLLPGWLLLLLLGGADSSSGRVCSSSSSS